MDDDTDLYLASDKENEIEISEESEPEAATEKSFCSTIKSTTEAKEKNNSSSKTKRLCVFKKQWIKDPKYAGFLQESPFFTSKILQQVKQYRFYSVSFDGSSKRNVKMFPFIINRFTLQSGLVKSVLEVTNQPRETTDDIVASLRDVLKMNGIDIQYITPIGADNTNTNFGHNHSVFSLIKSEVSNLFKGNCYCHILNSSVKISHHLLLVDIESSLSQLYCHFSSSSKRVAELKEYFEFVEEDYLCLLQHIEIRWLTLYISIARLLKVYDPSSAYFLNMDIEDEAKFLFDIQTKNLELQRYGTSIADLHRIITSLLKKLNDRLEQKYFGQQTRILLNAMPEDVHEKLISSFVKYLGSTIQYIHKYYDEHSLLAESVAIFGITEIDQIKFDQIAKCVAILNLAVDHDKLFEEIISLQNTYKEVNSYRESLFVQIEKYVGGHEIKKQMVNEVFEELDDEELVNKILTQAQNHQDSCHKIRPDQLWTFLIIKITTHCDETTQLISYVYSISCSNAFTEDVFSHMKHLWTNSRNSMLSETVAAELKIRLNFLLNIPSDARWDQKGITVAGGHGRGSATNQLSYPYGLFIDDDDEAMIITDYSNHRIVKWKIGEKSGHIVAGGSGQGDRLYQLSYPTDALVDKNTDSLIICDQGNKRVLQWSLSSGTTLGTILKDDIHCYGLATDYQRYLYISDEIRDEVRRYRIGENSGILVAGGGFGEGHGLKQLNCPTYLFVDQHQTVYVSDSLNHRVMKWHAGAKEGIIVAGGQNVSNARAELWDPKGVFVDASGIVYIADVYNHRVVRWPQGAKQGTVIVGGNYVGARENQFNELRDLSFDRHGNLYTVDHRNHRIQRFSLK
ncbi:unnamed protein product [Rotaria socialis]|uniref:Uncharacterized protein n=1 Tax=Rotaria socialis TaxID=392032 RepID=A0A818GWS5_9BILA|nr:unnamed protein product [Rotaria socialis]